MENETKNELITEGSEYSDGKDYSHLKPNLHLKKYKHLFEDGCVNCGSKEVTVTGPSDICHSCGYVYT
jgi:hypothetical protein